MGSLQVRLGEVRRAAGRVAGSGLVAITAVLVTGVAFGQQGGLTDLLGPRGVDGAPTQDIPLAQPVEPLESLEVPAKRDRLPDEKQVEVNRFVVVRLEPRGEAPPGCRDVIYEDFCGVPVQDPALDAKLATERERFDGRFSVFDLEDIALLVTKHFRESDRILDTAFIPPQTIVGGVVNIYVLTGRLGAIQVEGNRRYEDDLLAWPFAGLVGDPVSRRSVTHALLNVWDYPGLLFAPRKARITFVPGKETGETDIQLEVFEDPLPFNLVLSFDNAGSEYSGEYRPRAEVFWNNLTGAADQLAAGISYAFDPQNNVYWNVDYLRPVFTPDLHVGIGAGRSAYDIGADLGELGVTGFTEQAYLRANYIFFQSFRDRLVGEVRLARQDAQTDQNGEKLSDDRLAPLDIGIDYLFTDDLLAPAERANQTRVIAAYTHGFPNFLGSMDRVDAEASRINKDGERAGAEYDILVGGLIRKQAFFWDSVLWLRLNGQYTQDFLVPLEQFAIGGPNSVRAYPVAEYLFDKGWFGSLEWELGIPFLKSLEAKRPNCFYVPKWTSCGVPTKLSGAMSMSVFVDVAEGWLNQAREGELDHQYVGGVGFGLKYQSRNLRMGLSVATPVGSPEPSNGSDPQVFFNIAYQPF